MNTLRLLTLALAFSVSGTVIAAPVLRADVTVSAPVVTVGDMFEEAGLLAEQPLFRSPLPGTTGNVDLNAVRSAMARIGVTDINVNGLSQVRVSRDAAVIDHDLLASLIADDMRHRGILGNGMTANMLFSVPVEGIKVAISDTPARLESLRYLPGNGTFSARFLLSGIERPFDVTGTIELSIDAPHLVSGLPAGTVLRPDHIVMRPMPVLQADAQGVASLDQLVGMALNRQSRDGMLLRASDVSTPLAVAKNDPVTIYFRQGPMTLTVKGQAVTGAATGAPLQVLNLVSRRVISATVVAPGAVEVTSAPMTLAGL
ncbi:flagella basal body P-ring formation protein FlgA [Devosia lucknowensis]|uniref:Flagella basal body P-ring formation protein FlgA n=1 Tax=Devosia lucknowensis TaxID=1096929 RepID=A0A1Y6EUT6_9HYPH|nr:flagellar basal body P-ring formation chaperone FlgA [Devosia lucknowensis]SMQ66485.1 flagella basal body P-ring formation protein FlgA [Devosia lucknowensis]